MSLHSAAPGLFDTPELLLQIGKFLTLKDLTRCLQVSSAWNLNFCPQLWHTLDDTDGPWLAILNAANPARGRKAGQRLDQLKSAITKNAKHIRKLTTGHFMVLEAFNQTTMRKILPIELPLAPASEFERSVEPGCPETLVWLCCIWQLIAQNPNLETLYYNGLVASDKNSWLPSRTFLYKTIQSLTKLKAFERFPLNDDDLRNSVSPEGLKALKSLPNLKRLILHAYTPPDAQANILADFPGLDGFFVGHYGRDKRTSLSEDKLQMDTGGVTHLGMPDMLPFLCPSITISPRKLDALRVEDVTGGVDGLVHILKQAGPLKELHMANFTTDPITSLYSATTFQTLPMVMGHEEDLPVFDLRVLQMDKISSTDILIARNEDMEIGYLYEGLEWWSCTQRYGLNPDFYRRELSKFGNAGCFPPSRRHPWRSVLCPLLCTKLKVFIGDGHTIDPTSDTEGRAWASNNIKRLHLEIPGLQLKRFSNWDWDSDEEDAREMAGKLERVTARSAQISEKICKRIANFTHLKELHLKGLARTQDDAELAQSLRHMFALKEPGAVKDCGLDHLLKLDKLEEIYINELKGCFDREIWPARMKSKWPMLARHN
ncbi:hypothetical protein BGZ94_007786 [Podila epigama]|nr:hypothetical protein BGZ94_007786 [Podila epigama]